MIRFFETPPSDCPSQARRPRSGAQRVPLARPRAALRRAPPARRRTAPRRGPGPPPLHGSGGGLRAHGPGEAAGRAVPGHVPLQRAQHGGGGAVGRPAGAHMAGL
jgi:hypothetical protein